MNIIPAPLPKGCYSPRHMASVDGALIHYISAINIQPNDPFDVEAIRKILIDYDFSAHYLIDRDGTVMELVPLPMTAYHAGQSTMNGRSRCNTYMVGVELVGGAGIEYSPDQIPAVKDLLAMLMAAYGFPIKNIKGHDEVRAEWNRIHPLEKAAVKVDPGPQFPWPDVREALGMIV